MPLPPGITLNTSTGVISGTDTTETGIFNYVAQVTDANGQTATAACRIQVLPPATIGSPCSAANIGPPQPATDVFFQLTRVYASMKIAPRIPVRGS